MFLFRQLKTKTLCLLMLLTSVSVVTAQTPSDAVMMNPGEICIGVNYGHSAWSEYWEGELLRDNGNIGTLTTQSIGGGFMLGIIDRVNIIAMLPYVSTSPSAGVVEGDNGFQDAAFFIKGLLLEKELGKGKLKLLSSIGVAIPSTEYAPDHAFAIGLGCLDGIFRGSVHYDVNNGLYGRVDGAYHLRGNSFINRTYYYTTAGYYTDEVEMPNAVDFNATFGYIFPEKHVKIEGVFSGLSTIGGFDIRRQDGGFPSNDMEAMRIGLNADYYDLGIKGLAVHFSSNYTLTGRNVGKSMLLGGGVSYQFGIWDPRSKSDKSTTTPQAN